MNTFSTKDIVKKLIGPIAPAGDSSVDTARLSNLGQLTELVDELLEDIKDVASTRENGEASIVLAKRAAKKFLERTIEDLQGAL